MDEYEERPVEEGLGDKIHSLLIRNLETGESDEVDALYNMVTVSRRHPEVLSEEQDGSDISLKRHLDYCALRARLNLAGSEEWNDGNEEHMKYQEPDGFISARKELESQGDRVYEDCPEFYGFEREDIEWIHDDSTPSQTLESRLWKSGAQGDLF